MIIDTDNNRIIADEGKTFRRIGTDEILGVELWLGKSYYINGVVQDPPHLDIPADFDEVDNPDPEPEPFVEPEVSDSEALRIIIGE